MKNFGRRLRNLRMGQKKHMRELADFIGISVPYLSDIELGRRNPPQGEKLMKIAEFFGIELAELEVWIAEDRNRVEFDISDDSPMSKVALGLVRRQRTLSGEEAMKIMKILNKDLKYEKTEEATVKGAA